jgi:hypothetical protein
MQKSGDTTLARQGPDFLCVGMQKAGTGWLYDAFNSVDGFRMLPIKEFNHFDNLGSPHSKDPERRRKINQQMAKWRGGLSLKSRLRLSKAVKDYFKSGFSTPAYLKMFEANRDWLTGDITPSYSVLDTSGVAEVHKVLPDVPVFLIVRHPVDRAWSAFNMNHRRRAKAEGHRGLAELEGAISGKTTVEALVEFLAKPGIMSRSKPSVIADSWSIYGENLLVIGLEDIIREPKATVQRLATRVTGQEVTLPSSFEVKDRKTVRAKTKMTDEHREYLISVFSGEIAICKQRYPEIATNWKTS